MTVRELISELQKQDPDKEVLIQQGEELDYVVAYTVKEREIRYGDNEDDYDEYDETINAVVIEYT